MKVALIGASGFVGTAFLNEAVSRGYEVVAIARDPEKIAVDNALITKQAADVNNVEELAAIIAGSDAVVNTFNAGWTNPNLYDDFLKGSKAIQQATKQAGVKRLLVVGGAGSLEIAPGLQLVDTPQFPTAYYAGASAARDYLDIIREETELDWTFLSPAINLHPGQRTGVFRLGTDQPVFDEQQQCSISVEDMAVAIADELEKKQFIKTRFTLGY